MFQEVWQAGIPFFVFEELRQIPDFFHACTSRRTDTFVKDVPGVGQVAPGPQALMALAGIPEGQFFPIRQVHSAVVTTVSGRREPQVPQCDGVVIGVPGCFGAVKTADCLSILLVSTKSRSTALLHAGWRGTLGRIAAEGLRRFVVETGVAAEHVQAFLGPAIRQCCYEVGPEVQDAYSREGHPVGELFRERRLDIVAANRLQLESLGVKSVTDCGLCTGCRSDVFYSHRKAQDTGRNWMIAGFYA